MRVYKRVYSIEVESDDPDRLAKLDTQINDLVVNFTKAEAGRLITLKYEGAWMLKGNGPNEAP